VSDEILSQLRDIHWPAPVSMWPFALGVYGLLFFVLVLLVLVVFFVVSRIRRRTILNALLTEFSLIQTKFEDDLDAAALQASLSALLKRIIIHKNPTTLHRAFNLNEQKGALERTFPSAKRTAQIIELLEKDRYAKAPNVDGAYLLELVHEQLKRCRI